MKEYSDKMEEAYQLEADTNAEERWKSFQKVFMEAAEEIRGAPKEGNIWRRRPAVGRQRCRRA